MVECVRAVRGTAAGAAGMFSSYMQLCVKCHSIYLLALCTNCAHSHCVLQMAQCLLWNANLIQVAAVLVITKCTVTTALLCCVSTTGMLTMSSCVSKSDH